MEVYVSVIRTGPEPAKPAGLTGLQGWPVRSAKKFQKTGFLSRPGMEPAKTGRTSQKPAEPAGLDWGLRKLNLKKKNQNLITCLEMMDKMFDVYYPR